MECACAHDVSYFAMVFRTRQSDVKSQPSHLQKLFLPSQLTLIYQSSAKKSLHRVSNPLKENYVHDNNKICFLIKLSNVVYTARIKLFTNGSHFLDCSFNIKMRAEIIAQRELRALSISIVRERSSCVLT
jgi:hypothetical protein